MNKKILTTARLLFGGSFFIFGINGFLHIIPNPAMTADMVALLEAFAKTGYFFPMIKIIETTIGILLLANLFAPLATILITPILVGITSIHFFLNPAGLPMMIVLHALHGILIKGYRRNYQGLFVRKADTE